MPTPIADCAPVLRALYRFSDACGTQVAAAERLGVRKSTLSKWLRKHSLSAGTLQFLSAFQGDADVAQAAQAVLVASGKKQVSFNFGHIASQLACTGSDANMLFGMLERGAPIEDLEFAVVHDLVSTFSDMQYYNALSEVALEGLRQVPQHPLLELGRSEYELLVFPDEDEVEEVSGKEFDWSKVDWEEINEPYTRRSDAAHALFDCAANEPMHRLFDEIVERLYCRVRKREMGESFTERECLKVAAMAAVDCYKLESAVMEAAGTVRAAANVNRGLAARPVYAVATKIYEICFLSRTFTVARLEMLADSLSDDQETVSAIQGLCAFVYQALYSNKGAYYSGNHASAKVNAHGSVIDFESGRLVRSLVGKKRHAPKQAIVRVKSPPRDPPPKSRGAR
jgi:transposase-like protein